MASKVDRRNFAAGATAMASVAALWTLRKSSLSAVEAAASSPTVSVVEFTDGGQAKGTITVPRVKRTDAEWKARLNPTQFEVTRHAGTERAFTGATWNLHEAGIFRCICCDNALFNSNTKFESGTGWPSFWQPIAKQNVVESNDGTLGMERTAVSCRECDAHLGHVFDDGPKPTGLRYCMNSAAMRFAKA